MEMLRRASWLTFIGICASCSSEPEEDLGTAAVAVKSAPGDVACLRLTVAGARTVVKAYDLRPGEGTVFALKGLPLGPDTIGAEAFVVACRDADAAVPTWVADPVAVTLTAGATPNVSLTMRRNGQANVSVDFQDDGTGV